MPKRKSAEFPGLQLRHRNCHSNFDFCVEIFTLPWHMTYEFHSLSISKQTKIFCLNFCLTAHYPSVWSLLCTWNQSEKQTSCAKTAKSWILWMSSDFHKISKIYPPVLCASIFIILPHNRHRVGHFSKLSFDFLLSNNPYKVLSTDCLQKCQPSRAYLL